MKKLVLGFLALALTLAVGTVLACPPKGWREPRAHSPAWSLKEWPGQSLHGGFWCHMPFEREKTERLLQLKERFLKETAPLREELRRKWIELQKALLDDKYEEAERLTRELFKLREKILEKRLELRKEARQILGE